MCNRKMNTSGGWWKDKCQPENGKTQVLVLALVAMSPWVGHLAFWGSRFLCCEMKHSPGNGTYVFAFFGSSVTGRAFLEGVLRLYQLNGQKSMINLSMSIRRLAGKWSLIPNEPNPRELPSQPNRMDGDQQKWDENNGFHHLSTNLYSHIYTYWHPAVYPVTLTCQLQFKLYLFC